MLHHVNKLRNEYIADTYNMAALFPLKISILDHKTNDDNDKFLLLDHLYLMVYLLIAIFYPLIDIHLTSNILLLGFL
jgi:hypothetical protein